VDTWERKTLVSGKHAFPKKGILLALSLASFVSVLGLQGIISARQCLQPEVQQNRIKIHQNIGRSLGD